MKIRKNISTILIFAMMITSLVYTSSKSSANELTKISAPTYDAEKDSAVWDCIYFGSFPQDTLDLEQAQPVMWRVLSIDDEGNALIVTDKCVNKSDTSYKAEFWHIAFTEEENALITLKKAMSMEDACNPAYGFCSDPAKASRTRIAEVTKFALEFNDYITEEHAEDDLLPYEKYDVIKSWALSDVLMRDMTRNASKTVAVDAGTGVVNTSGVLIMNDQPSKPKKVLLSRYMAKVNLNEAKEWEYAGKVSSDDYEPEDKQVVVTTPSPAPKQTPAAADASGGNSKTESAATTKSKPVSAVKKASSVKAQTADSFTAKGLEFKVLSDKKSVSVIGFAGKSKKSTVTIPDKVNYKGAKYKVTEIADSAFKGASIKKVILGKNITKIGINAFTKCKKLKSIKLKGKKPEGVSKKLKKLIK